MSEGRDDDPVQAPPRQGLRRLWPGASRAQPSAPASTVPASLSGSTESLFGTLIGGDSRSHDDTLDSSPTGASSTGRAGRRAQGRASTDGKAGQTGSQAHRDPAWRPPHTASAQGLPPSGAARGADDADPALVQAAVLDEGTAPQRLYRVFVGARAVLGAALVGALVAGGMFGMQAPLSLVLIAIAYATQAVVLWMLPRFRQEDAGHDPLTRGQWLATIGVDLITFSLLHWMQPTQNFNFVALLLLPVLMGGVLATRTVALAGSSAVVLILLAVTWNVVAHAGGAATLWMQAGLAGVGFFAVTLLAGEMATRLKNQADAARGGLELARQQAQLNRLVIEEMTDGVMVVDRRSRVRAANPAARRLLVREGMGRAAPFQLQDDRSWAELQQLVNQAFERKAWVGSENNATLKFADGMTRTLRVRGRFTRRRSASTKGAADLRDGPREKLRSEVFCVVFLEDQRQVLDRNRQEKLAAMGRVSAGIAHEIRNPLAAIAQANALMMEEAQGREQAMLTRMIHENVERLKMIVDDVMAVAPSRGGVEPRIEAVSVVQRIVAEWSQSAGLSPGLSGARASGLPGATDGRLSIEVVPDRLPVIFDAEHLRRVLVNLLDNARRHATDAPGAFVLRLTASSDEHAVLSVASDGEAIAADVEPFLFEPFFSSRSRGTGLGLYICRELCERYGATIDYWAHPPESRHRNEFRVVLRRTDRADLGDQLPSDPQLLT